MEYVCTQCGKRDYTNPSDGNWPNGWVSQGFLFSKKWFCCEGHKRAFINLTEQSTTTKNHSSNIEKEEQRPTPTTETNDNDEWLF